jgi:hypothetical protein
MKIMSLGSFVWEQHVTTPAIGEGEDVDSYVEPVKGFFCFVLKSI